MKTILIIIVVVSAVLVMSLLITFFSLRKNLLKVRSTVTECFSNLKDTFYLKNKIIDKSILIYKNSLNETSKISSLSKEIEANDIDMNISTVQEYNLNNNLLNKKEKITSFLTENTSLKMNKEVLNQMFVLHSMGNQLAVAENAYNVFAAKQNKMINKFPYKIIAKMCKFDKFELLKE